MSRDGLAAARDQMRKDLDTRIASVMTEDTRRFEDAKMESIDAANAVETAKLRLEAARRRQTESLDEAKASEAKASQLPEDSPEREELLEAARHQRIMASAEEPVIAQHAANLPRLEQVAKERDAAVDAINADHVAREQALVDAEEQLDRLDNKIRLMDKEATASANSREAAAEAEALEMQGDTAGAAASRRDAARFQAEAEQAARDNAAISVDATSITDAGLTVGDDVIELAASGPTPAEQLNDRAFDVAEQAKAFRDQLTDTTEAKFAEIGVARDRAARDQYAAEESAKSADVQLRREQAAAKVDIDGAAKEEAKALAAEKRGDDRAAEEFRENAQSLRSSAEVHSNRAEQVQLDKADLEKEAADLKARVAELEGEKTALVQSGGTAAKELDKMEDQARLLLEASQKTEQAARLPPDDPRVATLQAEAQKALDSAAKLDVDEGAIQAGMPTLTDGVGAAAPAVAAVATEAPSRVAGPNVPDEVQAIAAAGPVSADQLNDQAFDIAARAHAIRTELTETTEAKFSEIGIARDRAARDSYAAEQAAKSASVQLEREQVAAKADIEGAAKEEAKAVAAEKRGDDRAAEELRENAQSLRSSADVHTKRADQVQLDKANLEKEAADLKARVTDLEGEKTALVQAGGAASQEVDKMEDQARLLLEASQKTEQAAALPPDDPRAEALKAQAQQALDDAAKLDVDEGKIQLVLPNAQVTSSAADGPGEPTDGPGQEEAAMAASDDGAMSVDEELGLLIGQPDDDIVITDLGSSSITSDALGMPEDDRNGLFSDDDLAGSDPQWVDAERVAMGLSPEQPDVSLPDLETSPLDVESTIDIPQFDQAEFETDVVDFASVVDTSMSEGADDATSLDDVES